MIFIWFIGCHVSIIFFIYFQAGYDYDEETFEKVFRRIYSTFGSAAPYTMFSDSKPFLKWARKEGLLVGLVSNAEYRYQDVILPAMGLNQVKKIMTWIFFYYQILIVRLIYLL